MLQGDISGSSSCGRELGSFWLLLTRAVVVAVGASLSDCQGTNHRVQTQKGSLLQCRREHCCSAWISWEGQVHVCSPQPHRGKIRNPKHSTAIRTFFQTTYFLIGSASSICVYFNVIGVCGYKIPHHEVFNARQTFLQNVEKSLFTS